MMTVNNKMKNKKQFEPSPDFIKNAIKEFIKNGGTIKKTKLSEHEYEAYIKMQSASEADEYLRGIL